MLIIDSYLSFYQNIIILSIYISSLLSVNFELGSSKVPILIFRIYCIKLDMDIWEMFQYV